MLFSFLMPKPSNMKLYIFLFGLSLFMIQACTSESNKSSVPSEESFSVIFGSVKVGHLNVTREGSSISVDYDYKNNGRGPTIKETIKLDSEGFPVQWDIAGNTTFGNSVDEHFSLQGQDASWTDATGDGSATISQPSLYITQFGSPYSLGIVAEALLNAPDQTLPALPAGELKLTEMEAINIPSDAGEAKLKTYALTGADLNPTYFVLDEDKRFFAFMTPEFIIIREGFEEEEEAIRQLAEKYSTERYEKIQEQFANNYEGNIRINNVRLFDPNTLALTELASVQVHGDRITRIDGPNMVSDDDQTVIDGAGGTLIPGLYDMHGHMADDDALLNVLAGVTSVRDMGNDNEVLDKLIQKIESGVLAGPRITRMGFIEGKSQFNNNNGLVVESEEEAIEAVVSYSDKGFYGIKLYNSMNGDWAPAIVEKAHSLNMPVTGHVPAFSNANAMIRAGFDELTHINQVILGWVLEPDEDTRTLLRLTALQRLPDLDLNSVPVNETLDMMVENKVAMDPTLTIHEVLLLSRNGETWQGTHDYIENMPSNEQRSYKVALANIANEKEDEAYRLAYDQILTTLNMMKDRGILILPGTDMGGWFTLHRELELYQQLGYTPAELLKLGSYDMAEYLGHEDRGSIEQGMLADFFLVPGDPTKDLKAIKTVSMVSRGGVFYYPDEIYPAFGITPFGEKPVVNNRIGN